MDKRGFITQEELKEALNYKPETGEFKWKVPRQGRQTGRHAGHFRCDGYIQIMVSGVSYLGHRLAWLYVYGEWPKYGIDHINGDPSDNRIKNLRDVPTFINNRNARQRNHNTSGATGVYWHKKARKWRVEICSEPGVNIYLGIFENMEDAISARKKAELEYGYSERHGSAVKES